MEQEGKKETTKAKAPSHTPATPTERGRGQVIKGKVVSDKMAKTRAIEIQRTERHSLYHKSLIRRSRVFIHDEKNESHTGDTVLAISTRPISRNKSFRLLKIVGKRVEQ